MLILTWRTWPEPVVDFGRELYVPWQLSEGKALYRDVAYFNGPLSPYFNAMIFRIFGVGLMSLVWVNIGVLVAVCVMLHRITAGIANELAATIGTCAFVLLLAVGQPGPIGNYNFITPYSHEMTHGLALALAAILSLMQWMKRRKRGWIGVSGALVGLVFLTKPEISLAVTIATLTGIIVKRAWRQLVLFGACAIAMPLLALLLLMIALPAHQALQGIVGAWRWSMDPRIISLPFYRRVRGTFAVIGSLRLLLWASVGYLICFAIPLLAGLRSRADSSRAAQFTTSFALVGILLLMLRSFIPWEQVGRPLLLVVIGCVAAFAGRAKEPPGLARLIFALFALVLLAKTALFVRLYHYGFTSTAPALMITLATLLCWLPNWINDREGSGGFLRGAAVAAIVVTVAMHLMSDITTVQQKTTVVGAGADAFYAGATGQTVNRIVDELTRTPAGSTVAVVPQGAMINYLARRASSIPYIVQMPPELIMFSQPRILESFRDAPPDYIVYLDTETSEYGVAGYSIDFGKPMFDWIMANYDPIGGEPRDPSLKWVLYRKRGPI